MPTTTLKQGSVLGKLATLISAVTPVSKSESDFTARLGPTVENWLNSP